VPTRQHGKEKVPPPFIKRTRLLSPNWNTRTPTLEFRPRWPAINRRINQKASQQKDEGASLVPSSFSV
jgi:hypothetical protein